MFTKLKDHIVDRYLTWKTGDDKVTRDWTAWYEVNVVYRASTIENMFMHFEHIVEVDWKKFITDDGLAWVPVPDAKQYFWPARELGNNCVWRLERVSWDQWQNRWDITDFGTEDKVFVATNSADDAMMIALKYS